MPMPMLMFEDLRRSTYDAVVVGAGPAGLSAAAEIASLGGRCLVIDQGVSHISRDRNAPEQILSGVGGAGLFSDGKHSFFPAATELWRLPDRAALLQAYTRTQALLARHGVDAPSFPSDDDVVLLDSAASLPADTGDTTDDETEPDSTSAKWQLKRYPSIYASLDERKRCIADLFEQCGELPWLSARVVDARRDRDRQELLSLVVDQRGERRIVETRNLIVATGRLSPRWIRSWLEPLGVRFELQRLEIGVRIETLASAPLFTMLEGVDPKLSFLEPDGSGTLLLTFCTCREGEIVLGSSGNIHAISGRADGPRTGKSSVGVLARITDPALVRTIERHMFFVDDVDISTSTNSFPLNPAQLRLRVPLADVLSSPSSLASTFGPEGGAIVARAVQRFVAEFPDLETDPIASVHGPCIEGVGDYPVSDRNLEIAPSVFIAGDACGRFRGIIASMISGRYVGARIES